MADEVTLSGDGALHVWLDPPAFLVVTADRVVLFDGGDASRVLWQRPPDPAAREITRALQTPGR